MTETDLVMILRDRVRLQPEAGALAGGDRELTYAGVLGAAEAVSGDLTGTGVVPGARVAVCLPNKLEWVVAHFGTLLAEAIAVPLNPLHDYAATAARLAHCGAQVMIVEPTASQGVLDAARDAGVKLLEVGQPSGVVAAGSGCDEPPRSPAPAVLAYIAQDSSRQIAAVLSHDALCSAAAVAANDVLRLTPEDTVLGAMPLMTIPGQTFCLNSAMAAGAKLIVPERLDVGQMVRVLVEQDVTVLSTVPLLLPELTRAVRRAKARPESLRGVVVSTGSPVPARVRAAVTETLGCELIECFGPPECSSLMCVTQPGTRHAEGSIGRPPMSVELAVNSGDVRAGSGELLVRGRQLMSGYWEDDEATERALREGWLHTGTDVRVDEMGNVFLLDGGWMNRLAQSRRLPRLFRGLRATH